MRVFRCPSGPHPRGASRLCHGTRVFRCPFGPHPRGASRLCQGTRLSGVPSPIIDPNKRHSKNRGVAQLVARLVWAAPASAACGGYSEQGLVQRRRAARAGHARDGGDTPQSGGPNRGTRPGFSYSGSVRLCSSAHHRGVAQLVARLVWENPPRPPHNFISGCSAVGSAPALGAGCRRFESCHSDHLS